MPLTSNKRIEKEPMSNVQEQVNSLSKALRLQVIEVLIKEDRIKYNAPRPTDEEMLYMVGYIDKLPCCTAQLRRLFEDAHDYHNDIEMFPHAATIGDLEYCCKHRTIGYSSSQHVPNSWLPFKADADLRRLPAFRQLANIYRPLIAAGKRILPPVDRKAVESEANAIVNELATNLIGER